MHIEAWLEFRSIISVTFTQPVHHASLSSWLDFDFGIPCFHLVGGTSIISDAVETNAKIIARCKYFPQNVASHCLFTWMH